MISIRRNHIWLLPSTHEDSIMSHLRDMAATAGMTLQDRRGERQEQAPPPEGELVVVDHPAAVGGLDPHQWIIVHTRSFEDSVEAMMAAAITFRPREAVSKLSTWLAFANYLTLHGAAPVDDLSTVVNAVMGAEPAVSHAKDDSGTHALSHYGSLPVAANATATWTPDIFSYTLGQEREGGSPEIDLIGRGRILVYGPDITLTSGEWKIEAEFDFLVFDDVVDLRFDWGHAEDTTTGFYKIEKAGRYKIEMTRSWLTNQTAELRLWVQHGMLHGQIHFLGAVVSRIA